MGGIVIPVGTLCLLIGDHSCAGYECTVTSPPEPSNSFHISAGRWRQGMYYDVSIRHDPLMPGHHHPWAARADQLLPLSPPPQTVDERERVPLTIPAIGVSIGYG